MKKLLSVALVLLMAFTLIGCGGGDEFPTRSIDLIIPWSAGGGTDVAGRLYAKYTEEALGQTINVLNVVGGNSAVGAAQAATSEPDGYTAVLLTYDILSVEAQGLAPISIRDFKMINKFSVQPTALVVHKDSGWETIEDYRQAALADPGGIDVAVNGEGAVWHQAGVLADREMGIEAQYIPYNGSSEQVAAMLGHHVQATYISYTSVLQHVEEGTLVVLGMMTEDRVELLPDVPTFKEVGYDAVLNSWRGIAVPKDTPDEVADVLREAFKAAYDNEEYQTMAREALIDGDYQAHDEFQEFLVESYDQVYDIMDELGFAKPEK
ncbi:MAG TPA: tripartite tricarboxylate transporter substrate binding protein [Clostridiaceae bacterium]|nr:tripartite tricarboxylate transporter substrate binding protein [Clostridiaceae bacterium]